MIPGFLMRKAEIISFFFHLVESLLMAFDDWAAMASGSGWQWKLRRATAASYKDLSKQSIHWSNGSEVTCGRASTNDTNGRERKRCNCSRSENAQTLCVSTYATGGKVVSARWASGRRSAAGRRTVWRVNEQRAPQLQRNWISWEIWGEHILSQIPSN